MVEYVNIGFNPITIVNNKEKNVVLISEDEWKNIEEILYLSSIPDDVNNIKNTEKWKDAIGILSKVNYVVHTDAIKSFIVSTLIEEQKRFIYAEEALAKNGNIRDYTDLLHLVILSNLETINASLISDNVPQGERLIKLNNNARVQMEALRNNKNIKDLELLQQKINNDKLLIEN